MSISSPYNTSECIPSCLPEDNALLIQDTRDLKICEIEVPSQRVPTHNAKTHVSNFTGGATDNLKSSLLTSGGVILLNGTTGSGTRTLTLPAASFANVGTTYTIIVAKEDSVGYVIKVNNVNTVANGGDLLIGGVMLGATIDAGSSNWSNGFLVKSGAAHNTLTLKTGTSGNVGGLNGTSITVTLVEATKWLVSGTVITGDVLSNTGAGIFTTTSP